MAYNKEHLVLVLDVRRTASEDFKQKATKCCADIIKQKICCGKKDYISFVLVGTNETSNDVNSNDCPDGYNNITQYRDELQLTSWKLLMNFYQFVNETPYEKGEWLDALVVAYGLLEKCAMSMKVQRKRIILFYDFNDCANTYGSFENITTNLLESEVELIVVSQNIKYIDNPANNNLPQAIFDSGKRSPQRLENEKYALRLVSECNAKLCNFNESLSTALKVKNKRPWTWNSQLRIGSKITINITGIIAAKNECTIKLKKVWNEPGEELVREWGYFIDGNQVCPEVDEFMDGYMLGGTAIPYDETNNDDKKKLPPGLTFMGFVPREMLYDEYFSGASTYLILHRRGMAASARMLDGLVRALLEADRAILCWKTYSEKYCKPKIVILLPDQIDDDCPTTLSMLEVAHHNQFHFFEFPKLTTRNTECSKEQLDAVDHLIDTMDLTLKAEDSDTPRDTFEKDLLSFDSLPHIFERNFMDLMERKILCRASEDDDQFQEMLKDKNFVEVYWKLHEKIEKDAKNAAKEVKKAFPLEVSDKWLQKVNARTNKTAVNKDAQTDGEENTNNNIELSFDHVRSATPAEDFEQLLKAYVFPIKDSTQRDIKFSHYACQLRFIVRNLIFQPKRTGSLDFDKICAALTAYRKRCFIFNAFDDYNLWISSIKTDVIERRLYQFWMDVIVKHELGLCFIGEPSLDEQIKEKDFYNLEFIENDTNMDDVTAN